MECIADVRATLGEGPVWVEREQALYWVDIPERTLFRWSRRRGIRLPAAVPPLFARAARRGRLHRRGL